MAEVAEVAEVAEPDPVAEFELGVAGTQLPASAGARPAGDTVTTKSSPWLRERCRTCGQTFRRGDTVRVAGSGDVRHLDPALRCAGGSAAAAVTDPAAEAARAEFAAGLAAVWRPLDGSPVVRLTASDWQVTRPDSGPVSPECPGCGHTFRAGDQVLVCPCPDDLDDPRRRPADPRVVGCGVTVHRDPDAGLACWDDWRPTGRLTRCPRTFERLPG
jgi:hypothetical protein